MSLTKNFTLAELLKSATATRKGYKEQFTPPVSVIRNLTLLAENILQPLRDFLGVPIFVNSGYRCERLNADIGGAKSSQHLTGQAADIEVSDGINNEGLIRAVVDSGVKFDQMIIEFRDSKGIPEWIHVSYAEKPRGQILEAYKDKGTTKYKQYSI